MSLFLLRINNINFAKTNMRFWRNKILINSLLVLFLGYYASITLFTHAHTVDNITVVHSHPYNPFSNDNRHTHTVNEIVLISILSYFIATITYSFFLFTSTTIQFKLHRIVRKKPGYKSLHFFKSNNFRAPPQSTI